MSHGVRRVRQSAEVEEARRQREASKLKEYLELEGNVMQKRKEKDWSQESFGLTTQLLKTNPEHYTVWNYRRDVMTNGIFPSSSPEAIHKLLSSELQMTFAALKSHPKVYWIWNHRRWCLGRTPDGPGSEATGDLTSDIHGWKRANWAFEMAVVEKMLDADSRNFHAWSYRRYVVASSPDPRTEQQELAYTTKKIESNFSNFSAWHQRSKLFSALWAKGEMTQPTVKEKEFDLIKQAIYTDPKDQSAWLYHRWLIGSGDDPELLKREIEAIQELLDIEPDTKWCIDSLVHYKRLLMKHDSQDVMRLKQECVDGLDQLIRIDPQRRHRYEDIKASLDK